MLSRLTEKGQVTIPKPLRESLGLQPGHQLEFTERDGALIVRRLAPADPLRQLVGIISDPADVDTYIEGARGAAWQADRDGDPG